MRVLVTGSRDWQDAGAVAGALDAMFDAAFIAGETEFVVVHGACPTGADQMASEWAQAMNDGDFAGIVAEERHPADWSRGRSAGPERNLAMVQTRPAACLAFIGDCTSPRCHRTDAHPSHGATGCANLAAASGIPTQRHYPALANATPTEPEEGDDE